MLAPVTIAQVESRRAIATAGRGRVRQIGGDLVSVGRELARIPREAALHRPRPPEAGLVLEVGSGDAPHPRADVVIDKYVADNFERAADLDLTRPLVVADGHRLPFADQTFHYVIALHVLEHATDPRRFAGELSRVAPAGFVQVPSRESDLTFAWPFHPWLIDRSGDTLVFSPQENQRAPCGEFFHRAYATSAMFRLWHAAHRSRWHHSVEWRGELSVEVTGTSTAVMAAEIDLERTVAALEAALTKGILRPLPPLVRERLCCPVCRSTLSFEARRIVCAGCGARYPRVGDVPVLLEEAVEAASPDRA
jgi:uncharacterized protein YbaR (Trm112 family)